MKLSELQPDERPSEDSYVIVPNQAFEVGNMVQFGDPKECGKITWIGYPTEDNEEFARVLAVRCT